MPTGCHGVFSAEKQRPTRVFPHAGPRSGSGWFVEQKDGFESVPGLPFRAVGQTRTFPCIREFGLQTQMFIDPPLQPTEVVRTLVRLSQCGTGVGGSYSWSLHLFGSEWDDIPGQGPRLGVGKKPTSAGVDLRQLVTFGDPGRQRTVRQRAWPAL